MAEVKYSPETNEHASEDAEYRDEEGAGKNLTADDFKPFAVIAFSLSVDLQESQDYRICLLVY